MIRHLKYAEIDKDKWDNCIKNSINSLPYAFSWYLDIVHDDWEALIEDDYLRVMPLTISRKYGITYFFQPFFVQQLGIFSKQALSSEITAKFLKAIPSFIKLTDFNLNHFNTIKENQFPNIENTNYLLDLILDYEKLYSSYSKNTKRNLKKANKSNLSLIKGVKPENIVKLFRENKGKDLDKWKDYHYRRLTRLIYTSMYKGVGTSYGVYSENNELTSAAFFLKTSGKLIFLFSGNSKLGMETHSMTYLIDAVIRENSPGMKTLDFEGSNIPGIARFYSGFGAYKSTYLRIKINRLNFLLKQIIAIIKK